MKYAVYSRRNPELKILALLDPETVNVTYTPNGVIEFKLNKNKLPKYHKFLLTVLPKRGEYPIIPYEKGRSVEDAVALFPPPGIPSIIDIDTSKAKVDIEKLGTTDQVKILKGLIILLTGGNQYTVSLETLHDPDTALDMYKIGTRPVEYYFLISRGNVVDVVMGVSGHAMALIVTQNELEIFDPNGLTPNHDLSDWVIELENEMYKRDGFRRTVIRSYDQLVCPQVLANDFAVKFHDSQALGDCTIWSYYYLWLRINNPGVNRDDIHHYIQRMPPMIMKTKSRLITGIISNTKPIFSLTVNDKTIKYDATNTYFWFGVYQICTSRLNATLPPILHGLNEEMSIGGSQKIVSDLNTEFSVPIFDLDIENITNYARGLISGMRILNPTINTVTITTLITSYRYRFKK